MLDAVVSDIKTHVGKGSDTHEFRPLTDEEKQHFVSSLNSEGRELLAERAGDATVSIEENEVFLGGGLLFPTHAGGQKSKSQQSQALLMESSSCRVTTTRSLEICPSRGATFLHVQVRSAVKRFVFLVVGSVIVALLFVNFYPLLRAGISQSDLLKPSGPNPIQLPTATQATTRDTTSPPVLTPAVQTQSEVEAQPAAQAPAKVEPAVQAPPQIPAKVQPAARATRAQASSPMKKQSHQQRAVQLAEPPWSRDADSFIRYLFFGRVD